MTSIRSICVATLCAAAVTVEAGAQQVELFVGYGVQDTVLGIATGQTGKMQLRHNDYTCVGVSSYSVTVFFDNARLHFASGDATNEWPYVPAPVVDTSVAGQVTLTGVGGDVSVCSTPLANMFFTMDPLALEGSLLSLRVNTLDDWSGATLIQPALQTSLLDVCQAVRVWGDVDADLLANSRDALVLLTSALGLPTVGFDLTDGDVNGDQVVNTRDALMVLSASVGLWVPDEVTAGKGIPNRCAPLALAPATMAFWRDGTLFKVVQGDSIATNLGPTGNLSYAPSWAPDGSRFAFTTFVAGFGDDIMTLDANGTAPDTLLASAGSDFSASWSPDGTRIAYVSNSAVPQSIFISNVDGTNPVQITTTHVAYRVSWSPDGSRLLFTGYDQFLCCATHLWLVNADGTGLQELFLGSDAQFPADPAWAPTSDSVLYRNGNDGILYKAQAGLGSPGVPATQAFGGQQHGVWNASGFVFQSMLRFPSELYFFDAALGRQLRLSRSTNGDDRPGLVRSGLTYVNAVAVAPVSATISASVPPLTQQFTATVTDNLAAPIVPGSGVTWSSSNTLVATVDATGLVTAVSAGIVTITATTGGWRSSTASVTVNQ